MRILIVIFNSLFIDMSDINNHKSHVNNEWEENLVSDFVEEFLPQEHNDDSD